MAACEKAGYGLSGIVSTDPLIGTLAAGRYRILKLLGEGGMGRVYLAEHEAIEKKLALKVLHLEYSRKDEIVTRFQQEAISASRIRHPNVLEVFDFGRVEDGSFFLAMEFLDGNDLAVELQHKRVLNPGRALRIALQVCRALAAAHAKGVIHRDLKPENIFLQRTADAEEIVKIVDFGIAQLRNADEAPVSEQKRRRLTKTGMIFGTPEYMAPEQAGGREVDQRTDVYALGVILYEMFTGAVPFTGDSFMAVLAKTLQDEPPTMYSVAPECTVSTELHAVVMGALQKDRDARFGSMADLARALIATPEGAGFRGSSGSLSDIPPGSFMSPFTANPTAAQFPHSGQKAERTLLSADVSEQSRSPDPPAGSSRLPDPPAGSRSPAPSAHRALPALTSELASLASDRVSRPSADRAARWPWFFGVGLVVAGAGAVWFLARPKPADVPELAAAEPVASASAAPEVPAASAEEAASEPAPVPSAEVAPATRVVLDVETEPAGAIVLKDGFQVCDQTPCEVIVAQDESFELEARLGNRRGAQKVLAQRDQTVQIALNPPPKRPAKPKPKPKATATLCEVEVDGLKILRPCK